MRYTAWALVLLVLGSVAACTRPMAINPDAGQDSGGGTGDGAVEAGSDAGTDAGSIDVGLPDAPCADDDGDGVCNAADVCSVGDDAVDADSDAVPDACDCDASAATVCSAMAVCSDGSDGVVCTCMPGYTGDGATCMPVDCGPLTAPANGTVDATVTTFGSVATYGCSPGYALTGDATRTCGADMLWTGAEPTCVASDCPGLSAPPSGSVSITGSGVGALATYSCSAGFRLQGGQYRECGAGLTWVGEQPTCVQLVTCVCGGAYAVGEPIRRTSATGGGPPVGTVGVVRGGGGSPPLLTEWTGWSGGHGGNCSFSTCPGCTDIPGGTSRYYVDCPTVATQRLACACDGVYYPGDRVVALHDSPSGAVGLSAGTRGTVIAATSSSVLVQWDGWAGGHNGNCPAATCGTCTPLGMARWYTDCNQLGRSP